MRYLLVLAATILPQTVNAAAIYIDRWDNASVAFDRGNLDDYGKPIMWHEGYDAYIKLRGDLELNTFTLERFDVWGVDRQAVGFSLPPMVLDLLPNINPLITSKHAWAKVDGYDYLFELYPHNLVRILARDPVTGMQTYPPTSYDNGARFSYYWGMANTVVPEPTSYLMLLVGVAVYVCAACAANRCDQCTNNVPAGSKKVCEFKHSEK
jgi:hypothetical protein